MTIAQILIKYLSKYVAFNPCKSHTHACTHTESVNFKNFGQARRKHVKLVKYAKNAAEHNSSNVREREKGTPK